MRAVRADPRRIPFARTLDAGLARCLAADRSVLEWLVCPVHLYRSLATGGAAFPIDLEGTRAQVAVSSSSWATAATLRAASTTPAVAKSLACSSDVLVPAVEFEHVSMFAPGDRKL
jgi:hypothetical protein